MNIIGLVVLLSWYNDELLKVSNNLLFYYIPKSCEIVIIRTKQDVEADRKANKYCANNDNEAFLERERCGKN